MYRYCRTVLFAPLGKPAAHVPKALSQLLNGFVGRWIDNRFRTESAGGVPVIKTIHRCNGFKCLRVTERDAVRCEMAAQALGLRFEGEGVDV